MCLMAIKIAYVRRRRRQFSRLFVCESSSLSSYMRAFKFQSIENELGWGRWFVIHLARLCIVFSFLFYFLNKLNEIRIEQHKITSFLIGNYFFMTLLSHFFYWFDYLIDLCLPEMWYFIEFWFNKFLQVLKVCWT